MNAQSKWKELWRESRKCNSADERKEYINYAIRHRREAALERKLEAAQRTIEAQAQQLRTACNEVTDDVTQLSWLQSLITEAERHIEVLSDGDLDAGYTCIREVQALHDALKAMLNGGAA